MTAPLTLVVVWRSGPIHVAEDGPVTPLHLTRPCRRPFSVAPESDLAVDGSSVKDIGRKSWFLQICSG